MGIEPQLGQTRTSIYRVSSSISNWREKTLTKYKAEEYVWWKHMFKPVTFFGLYRPSDFLACLVHRGDRTIHWQGSDILAAGWHYRWLQKIKAKHICENEVEQGVLRLMLQQEVEIRPTFLSNPHDYKVSFKPSKKPHVFIHVNRRAECESGLSTLIRISRSCADITFHVYGRVEKPDTIPSNFVFHGYVSESEFDEEIKAYQAGLRLHEFDGFSEVLAKSILMGQYPISRIRYPYIHSYDNEAQLIKLLNRLKNKKLPNYVARNYYLKAFHDELHTL